MKLAIYASLRRRLLYYFKPGYVRKMARLRKGGCETCKGVCCYRTRRCPLLKKGKCSIYAKMPLFCKVFPIDPKDIELAGVKDVCGYYWISRR